MMKVTARLTGARRFPLVWSNARELTISFPFLDFTSVKISNNALNFLLAQYRAIFKRAYVKGIASAVLLTAGLAAGQAQAANENLLDIVAELPSTDTVTIDGTSDGTNNAFKNIAISTDKTTTFNGEVKIIGGSGVGAITEGTNYIAGTAPINISGQGKLTIDASSNPETVGLKILGYSANAGSGDVTIDIKTIDVRNGVLNLLDSGTSTQSGNVTVAADTITIGNDASSSATVTLTGATANGVTLGRAAAADGSKVGSTITVKDGGKLVLNDESTNADTNTIEGALLKVESGGVILTSDGNANDIHADDWQLESDAFHIVSGSGVSGSFTGYNGDLYGNVLIDDGATFSFKNTEDKKDKEGNVITEANVTVHKDANFQIGGTLKVEGGTLTFEDGAKLFTDTNTSSLKSTIVVTSGADATEVGTLAIGADTLSQFLTGKGADNKTINFAAINAATESIAEEAETPAASGSLVLSTSRLEITGTSASDSFDLSTLNFSGANNANAGKAGNIVLDKTGTNTIAGDYLTISEQLKDSDSSPLQAANGNLFIEAKTLTLGDTEDYEGDSAFGFSGAKAQNLVLKVKSGSDFVLQDKVTLSATRQVTQGDEILIEADNGTISGNITVSGGATNGLTIENGLYTNKGNITISGGALTVKNTGVEVDGETQHVDTRFDLSGTLTLTAGTANGKIEVDGTSQDADDSTILDITNAKVVVSSGSDNPVALNISNGGTLLASSQNLKDLFDIPSDKSGAGVFISGGTVEITKGAVELNQSQLTSGAQAVSSKIVFSNSATSVGTFKVDGSLTINGVTGLDIGESGAIIADTLTLNNEKSGTPGTYAPAVLKSGKYVAQSTLNSANKTNTINISGAQVFLGDFNELKDAEGHTYYEAVEGSDSGHIDVNLTLTKAGSGLTVQNGSWTGQSVTVTAGDLNVGLRDSLGFDSNGVKKDVNDEAIGASLKLDSLTLGTAGTATIADVGTLDTTSLTVNNSASGALTVSGVANVAGNHTPAVTTGENQTPESFGVVLTGGDGSIHVTTGGSLTFGSEATEAITLDPAQSEDDKDAVALNSIVFGSAPNQIFNVEAGGKITFSFSENQTFSAEALADMRTKLFTNLSADGMVQGTINLGNAQLAGVKADTDGAYKWSDLKGYSDVADFTTEEIRQSVVKGIASTDNVRGHFGALKAENMNTGNQITIVGDTSLNNADDQNGIFALGNNGAVLGLNITEPSLVQLNNGGQIGQITLGNADSTLAINHDKTITAPADTLIQSIKGDGTAEFNLGKSTIAENSDMGNLVTNVGSDVIFKGTLTVGTAGTPAADAPETVLAGTSNTFEGEATFNNNTYIEGAATFQDGVTFNSNETGIYANTEVTGGATFATNSSRVEIGGNSTFTADSIELNGTGIHFVVGEEDYVENGQTHEGSTGYLQADAFKLAGNTLVVDPSYERETSIAYVKNFTDGDSKEDAGIFSGKLIAGQNAALIVGTSKDVYDDAMAVIKGYQNSRGALIEDEVGSLVYIGDQLTAKDDSRIIIDSQRTQEQIFGSKDGTIKGALKDGSYQATYQNGSQKFDADLFLGVNTVMVVSDNILDKKDNVAVHFQSNDAYIMAEKAEGKEHAAKIVLDGNGFLDSREVTLFTDNAAAGGNNGVKILGDQDIRVETLNGVMYFMLNAGKEVTGGTLNLDTTKIDTAFLGATDESRNLLFAYTSQTANWEEYFDEANLAKADTDPTKVKREQLHGDVASNTIANYAYTP